MSRVRVPLLALVGSRARWRMPERHTMDIELPDTISAETIQRAGPAIAALRVLLADGPLPTGLTEDAVEALVAVMTGVTEAATDENSDLNPSEAADRLRLARPSVM